MALIFIDIETLRLQKDDPRMGDFIASIKPPAQIKLPESKAKWLADPANIEEAINGTSFDPLYGKVAVAGVAVENETVKCFFSADEGELLTDLFAELSTYRDMHPTFVGHNVLWDLRFILSRAIILGIKPPAFVIEAARGKPWSHMIADTMLMWNADPGKRVSLDSLCLAMGIASPKEAFNGSMVSPAIEAGELAKVVAYNIDDVVATRAVYNRLVFA